MRTPIQETRPELRKQITRVWERARNANLQVASKTLEEKEFELFKDKVSVAPKYIEKHCKVSDFLRCLLTQPEGVSKQKRNLRLQRRSIVELIIALQEQLDSDEIVKLLVNYDRVGCIFLSIDDKRFEKDRQR